MKKIIEKIEQFLELGGVKKDIVLLVISGISLLLSIFHVVPLPFDIAWVAIVSDVVLELDTPANSAHVLIV